MEYLGLSARLVVAMVFLAAAASKLRNPRGFRSAVANYQILPDAMVGPVSRALPVLEAVVGLALLLGVLIIPVAAIAAVVLAVFAAGIWVNVRRGRRIGCGCGFRRRQEVSRRLVLRNYALVLAAIAAAVWPSAALAVFPGPGVGPSEIPGADAVGVLVATTAGAALVLLIIEVRRFLGARGSSLLHAVSGG